MFFSTRQDSKLDWMRLQIKSERTDIRTTNDISMDFDDGGRKVDRRTHDVYDAHIGGEEYNKEELDYSYCMYT